MDSSGQNALRWQPTPGMTRALGVLAVVWYCVSGGEGALRGNWEDFLWTCAVGLLLTGVGLVGRWATLAAMGTLFLIFGNALWIVELLGGRAWTWFSVVTHCGGFVVGLIAVRSLGIPKGTWWKTVIALLALQQLCRWVTPPEANVNLAHRVWKGYESTFPTFASYMGFLIAVGSASFFVSELLLRRFVAPAVEEGAAWHSPETAATVSHEPTASETPLEDHAPPAQGPAG